MKINYCGAIVFGTSIVAHKTRLVKWVLRFRSFLSVLQKLRFLRLAEIDNVRDVEGSRRQFFVRAIPDDPGWLAGYINWSTSMCCPKPVVLSLKFTHGRRNPGRSAHKLPNEQTTNTHSCTYSETSEAMTTR